MRILFLGCGNMIQSMLPRLKQAAHHYYFYSPSGASAEAAKQLVGGEILFSLDQLPEVDAYVLACKPQQFSSLAEKLIGRLDENALVVSIMASINVERIQKFLKVYQVLRIMPNTPVKVGQGILPLFFSHDVPNGLREKWHQILSPLGLHFEVQDERKLDELTPFSGSGPGFIFELAHQWQLLLQERGYTPELAQQVISKLFLGAGKLMEESYLAQESFEDLRNTVTSKGGITAAGLAVMHRPEFKKLMADIFLEADHRGHQLKGCD